MKRSTILVAVAVAVVTAALTAQAGAVPGPVAQQETPTESPTPTETGTPAEETPTEDGTPAEETPTETGTPAEETPTEDEPLTPEEDTPTETPDDGVGVSEDNETTETEDPSSLTFEDQESNGTTVTVSDVTLNQSGYVVIHDDTLEDGQTVDSVIGVSDYLPAGEYDNVTVTLFDVPGANYTAEGDQTSNVTVNETANDTEPSLTGNQELIAMLHVENSPGQAMDDGTDENQTMTPTETPTEGGTTETPTAGTDDQTAASENQTFDFVETVGLLDTPVLVNETPVTDTANVTVVDDTDANETATPTEDGTATPTEDGTATPTETGATTPTEGTATPTTPS